MSEFSMLFTGGLQDGGPVSQKNWWRIFRAVLGPKARTADVGVVKRVLDELAASVAGADRVDLESGQAFVQGTLYENTSTIEVDENAHRPGVGTTGKRLVLRRDAVNGGVRATVLRSADGTATLPALTQDEDGEWDIPLWSFTHATNGDIGALTDEREFIAIGGGGMKRSIDGGAFLIPATAGTGVNVTSGTAGVAGAWEQMVASTSVDLLITDVIVQYNSGAWGYVTIEIGVGSGGNEVVRGIVQAKAIGSPNNVPTPTIPVIPPIFVEAGSRIAVRITDGTSAVSHAVTLRAQSPETMEDF